MTLPKNGIIVPSGHNPPMIRRALQTVREYLSEIYGHLLTVQAFIPVPLTSFRELAAGAVQNLAAHGGALASDSTPILEIANDGLRINWAATDVAEIVAPIILPPDVDTSENLVVHTIAMMGGATDTTTNLDGEIYQGESDTNFYPAPGASNLLTTSKAEQTATLSASDVAAGAVSANLSLTLFPEAHDNDAVYLYAVWVEYTRKILTS